VLTNENAAQIVADHFLETELDKLRASQK